MKEPHMIRLPLAGFLFAVLAGVSMSNQQIAYGATSPGCAANHAGSALDALR